MTDPVRMRAMRRHADEAGLLAFQASERYPENAAEAAGLGQLSQAHSLASLSIALSEGASLPPAPECTCYGSARAAPDCPLHGHTA